MSQPLFELGEKGDSRLVVGVVGMEMEESDGVERPDADPNSSHAPESMPPTDASEESTSQSNRPTKSHPLEMLAVG